MPRQKQAKAKGQRKTQTEIRTATAAPSEANSVQDLVSLIRENVTQQGKFIQIDKDLKKIGPGLSLSGLQRVYKHPERSDFVYTQEFRFAGPSAQVDKVLGELGSSLAGQRIKNDIVDATNYESFIVARVPKEKAPAVEILFTHDQISKLAQFVKTHKQEAKKDDKTTPKKKKAQRRKSPVGHIVKKDEVDVFRITGTVQAIGDLIKGLNQSQKGLDVSTITYDESTEGLKLLGSRTFKVSAKSSRKPIPYAEGYIYSQTKESLEEFLQKIGHSSEEVKAVVDLFETKPQAPKEAKEEGKAKEAPKPKEVKAKEAKAKEVKPAPKAVAKKADEEKKKSKKADAKQSPKVTKAKTRTVKPRTSNE